MNILCLIKLTSKIQERLKFVLNGNQLSLPQPQYNDKYNPHLERSPQYYTAA